MDTEQTPWPETARLAALGYYQILDTPPEPEFDDITSLAAQICDTPIALMSLIDHNRQWFKSKIGLEISETPRELAICNHAMRAGGFFTIPDAQLDRRFRDNPMVTEEPHARFYAGAPLVSRENLPLGMLCVLDRQARDIDYSQKRALEQLARQVMSMLELRALRQLNTGADGHHEAFCTLDLAFRFTYVSGLAEGLLGARDANLLGSEFWSQITRSDRVRPDGRRQRKFVEGDFDGFEAFCPITKKWIHFWIQRSLSGLSLYLTDVTRTHQEKAHLSLLETAVSRLNDIVIICDTEPNAHPGPNVVFVNDAFSRVTGYSRDEIIGQSPRILHGDNTQLEARQQIRAALDQWQSVRTEVINYKKSGEEIWLELDMAPIADETGWYTHWVSVERNITQRKRYEFLREAEARIFRSISLGEKLVEIFMQILVAADKVFAGARTAIMTLDADGLHARHGASPNLPAPYVDAIDGLTIGPNIGSCGTAMYRRETIIVSDIASDPLWADYRLVALAHSLRACWSVPVIGGDGAVLASFSIYWDTPKSPVGSDLELAERFSRLVSLAMEQSRKEEALRDSELRFRQLADAIDEVFWMANYHASSILYVSPAYDTIWGKPGHELYSNRHAWLEGVHEDDQAWVHAKRYNDNGDLPPIEYRIRRGDGSIRWVLDRVYPVLDDQGQITRIVGVTKDITDEKNYKEQIIKREERLRLVANITTDVIWDYDVATGEYWWGDGGNSVFGYKPTDENGETLFFGYIEAADRWRVFDSIQRVLEGPAREWSSEYNFTRADGSTALVSNRAIIVRDDHGVAVRMVGGISDITAQREIDGRLRQSQRLEAIGQLTGGIAHDFNNLLQVIISNAEYLQDALTQDRQLGTIAALITAAADQGALLIERLLTFSRRQTLQTKPVNVRYLVTRLETTLRRTLGENIEIMIFCPRTCWFALVDSSQLENALLNLAINSRDAMPQGGRLSIKIENVHLDKSHDGKFDEFVPGDYLMIVVADNGAGMEEAILSHAFEPFFTTKDVGKGTGLGLSMVYGFVKQSNGYLMMESRVGAGTTATMYLPRAAEEIEGPLSARQAGEDAKGSGRILVVEDNDLVRGQVSVQLEALGYEIMAARNAADALNVLTRCGPFDLLFTDIVMPGGMNGYQLASEARRLVPNIRVLLTTGYSDQTVNNLAGLDPEINLISKPYHRRQLSLKLQEIMTSQVPA